MHYYYKTITVSTIAVFLYEIDKLKGSGFELVSTNSDKSITFDGKNTVERQVKISASLKKGTAIYVVECLI